MRTNDRDEEITTSWPPSRWAAVAALVLLGMTAACSSDDEESSEVESSIAAIHATLKEQIELRDRTMTTPPAEEEDGGDPSGPEGGPPGMPFDTRLEDLAQAREEIREELTRLRQAEPRPAVTEEISRLEWQLEAVRRETRELVEAREERALRGSVESYRHAAEVEWTKTFADELGRKLELRSPLLPANEYRLFNGPELEDRRSQWQMHEKYYQAQAAAAPDDTAAQKAVHQAQARLKLIEMALADPALTFNPRSFYKPRSALAGEDVDAWCRSQRAGREQGVAEREAGLLKTALARDRMDVAAYSRLRQVQAKHDSTFDAGDVLRARGARVLRRNQGFAPAANGVADMMLRRFSDPLGAVVAEANLRLQFEEHSRIKDALPEQLRTSFLDWAVSHLRDGELARLRGRLAHLRAFLDAAVAEAGTPAQGPLGHDRRTVEQEYLAVEREIDHRRRHGSGRMPDFDKVAPEVRRMFARHAADSQPISLNGSTELPRGARARQHLLQSIERYQARTEIPLAESGVLREQLILRGFDDSITELESTGRRLYELRDKLALKSDVGGAKEIRTLLSGSLDLILRQGQHLLRGIRRADLHASSEAADQRRRILALVPYRHGPPGSHGGGNGSHPPPGPDGGRGAVAYGDAVQRNHQLALNQNLTALESRHAQLSGLPEKKAPAKVMLESDARFRVHEATKEARPKLEGWRVDNRVVAFDHIKNLKSMRFLPGGVSLGSMAEVDGDWSAWQLVYDGGQKRLKLVRAQEDARGAVVFEEVLFPPVEPEILRACFLYAADDDPVAVSIGYGGGSDTLAFNPKSRVILHPVLRDTQVGLDVILADRFPWKLFERELPNGRRNPFYAEMKDFHSAIAKQVAIDRKVAAIARVLAKLADIDSIDEPGAGLDPARRKKMLRVAAKPVAGEEDHMSQIVRAIALADTEQAEKQLAMQRRLGVYVLILSKENPALEDIEMAQLLADPDLHQLREFFAGLPADPGAAILALAVSPIAEKVAESAEEPDSSVDIDLSLLARAGLAFLASSSGRESSTREAAEQLVYLVDSRRLSLIKDQRIRFRRRGRTMVPEVKLSVEYVHTPIILDGRSVRRSDEVLKHDEASRRATRIVESVANGRGNVYPQIGRTRVYAQWIALMRWALQSEQGGPGALDLSQLTATEYRTADTPDFLLRGSDTDVATATRELGVSTR